nr:MAG TPA: protein of unknown function UPF0697 [Caudoviricetes sp.]
MVYYECSVFMFTVSFLSLSGVFGGLFFYAKKNKESV